jgi:hypothetical protein
VGRDSISISIAPASDVVCLCIDNIPISGLRSIRIACSGLSANGTPRNFCKEDEKMKTIITFFLLSLTALGLCIGYMVGRRSKPSEYVIHIDGAEKITALEKENHTLYCQVLNYSGADEKSLKEASRDTSLIGYEAQE